MCVADRKAAPTVWRPPMIWITIFALVSNAVCITLALKVAGDI
jgi:Co/Zn/Cd efflux system component